MKREKIVTGLTGFVLSCLLSFGAMGCMISGLELPVDHAEALYAAWFVSAALGTVLFSLKKRWIPALLAAVLGLWCISEYGGHFLALITRLSRVYNSAYHWGTLEFAGVEWWLIPADLPLAVWGSLLAMSAAATVVWGRGLSLTLLLALLPVGSTVVVTNTPPDSTPLFAVMLALALLLLTSTVRRHSPQQGARLAVLTALPVWLLLNLLFILCPQEGYVNRSEEYLDRVVSWGQRLISVSFDNSGLGEAPAVGPNESVTNNISRLGPRRTLGYTVLKVEADFSDTLYLRGQDFDSYDGKSWTATADREEGFGGLTPQGRWVYEGTVTIRTANVANVLYLPYYPEDEQTVTGGRIENDAKLREYSFGVRSPMDANMVIFDAPIDSGFNTGRYTNLPADTRRWAVQYLSAHGLSHSVDQELAKAIADHVRDSALYDTNPDRMSRDGEEFVRWFLEEADRGYCVHFATATAVLLRAAGIPARYVTGYMLQTEADGTVEVTDEQAHAWAEYYNESLGAWVVLESTPADLRQEETEPPQTQPRPTDPTKPTDAPKPGSDIQIDIDADPGNNAKPSVDLKQLWSAVKWLLLPLGLWLGLEVQYRLRIRLRRRSGGPNTRALAKWQEAEMICRFTRQVPPGALKELAQKAKFSQHTLNAEELAVFDVWLKDERQKLEKKPWYVRLVGRYILALW